MAKTKGEHLVAIRAAAGDLKAEKAGQSWFDICGGDGEEVIRAKNGLERVLRAYLKAGYSAEEFPKDIKKSKLVGAALQEIGHVTVSKEVHTALISEVLARFQYESTHNEVEEDEVVAASAKLNARLHAYLKDGYKTDELPSALQNSPIIQSALKEVRLAAHIEGLRSALNTIENLWARGGDTALQFALTGPTSEEIEATNTVLHEKIRAYLDEGFTLSQLPRSVAKSFIFQQELKEVTGAKAGATPSIAG